MARPQAKAKLPATKRAARYVYAFGGGRKDGRAEMKALLGGKGANLAEMSRLGLPVPPGFTITTDVCTWYYAHGRAYPSALRGQVKDARALLELAVQNLERAAELTGGDPVIAEHLGDAYLLLDRKRNALEKYQEAIGLGPRLDEQPQLHQKYERLQRELEGR